MTSPCPVCVVHEFLTKPSSRPGNSLNINIPTVNVTITTEFGPSWIGLTYKSLTVSSITTFI